jgi:hypothetical protein
MLAGTSLSLILYIDTPLPMPLGKQLNNSRIDYLKFFKETKLITHCKMCATFHLF